MNPLYILGGAIVVGGALFGLAAHNRSKFELEREKRRRAQKEHKWHPTRTESFGDAIGACYQHDLPKKPKRWHELQKERVIPVKVKPSVSKPTIVPVHDEVDKLYDIEEEGKYKKEVKGQNDGHGTT